MKYSQYIFTFLMGYFIYAFVEIAARGFTHWTMCLTGGLALTLLHLINSRKTMNLIKSCLAGSIVITILEFTVGIFDNIIMGWHVWDYSNQPFNLIGQICPLFSALWFILCIPAFFLTRKIRRRFDQIQRVYL